MSLKSIVQKLSGLAEANEERAYKILGSRPGPGFDLLIKPEEPLCGKWHVTGKTPCGSAFINKFWRWQPLSNQKLAEMKKQAVGWGVTFQTIYPYISNTPIMEIEEPM